LSFSGLLLCACAATAKPGSFAVADCSGTPLPRLRHRQGFIGDPRLQRGPRVARWWRWWHLVLQAQSTPRWPASPGAGHARPVHDDASPNTSDATSLAACLTVCLPIPASLIDRDPHSLRLSGWPSGHLLRCSLNGVLPQTQRIPCLTGLNPRALDSQTSAASPRTSPDVQLP